MTRSKSLCIDLRWIDSSGVGVYIQGIVPGILSHLKDTLINGIGNQHRLKEFTWSRLPNFRVIHSTIKRYSILEQIGLPLAIPRNTDLFFSPYYTIPILYRGNLAVTVHDMSHLVVPEIINNRIKQFYARTMFKAVRRQAKLIFTVSDFSRSELLTHTSGSGKNQIVTTHLGVGAEWQNASHLSPIHPRPYFVCVGNIKPYKNVRRLVQAYLAVKNRIPHDLILVGQNDGLITGESDDFFDLVRQSEDRVLLTGKVSQNNLLSLVGNATALLMPSLYEGFGLPPLEAMKAGVPIGVARAASLPEVCGEAALYFDPLSADEIVKTLLSLSHDSGLRRKMIEAGRMRSAKFTWEACSQLTAFALEKCLDSC